MFSHSRFRSASGITGANSLLVGKPPAECQTPELDDNFEEDPEENG